MIKLIIEVVDGMVNSVTASAPINIQVIVVDHDTDGVDPDDLTEFDGMTVILREEEVLVNSNVASVEI